VARPNVNTVDAEPAADDVADEALLQRIRAGDQVAFATLVQRHTPRFYRIAWRVLGRNEDVEDILQEAFLRLWTRPDQWQPGRGARFTTWFHRVVVNLALDRLRGERRRNELNHLQAVAEVEPGPLPADEQGEAVRRAARVAAAIDALPDRQRTAVRLMFHEGLSGNEAAQAMGLRLKALQALVTRARAALRAALAADIAEEELT
jgi:RNA polymerase sigma-70 factor (ECF subfamily)